MDAPTSPCLADVEAPGHPQAERQRSASGLSPSLDEGTLRPAPETAGPRARSEAAVSAVRLDLKRAALLLVLAGLALAICSVR